MAGRRAAAGLVGLALIMMTMSTPALASSRDADMDGEDMDGECTSDHALLLSNNKLRQELQQAKDAARRKDVGQDKELHRLQSEAKESWGLISWCFVTFLVCLIITTVNNWLFQARTVEGQGYIRRVGLRLGLTRDGGNITGVDIGFEEVPHCLSLSFHCPFDVHAVPFTVFDLPLSPPPHGP